MNKRYALSLLLLVLVTSFSLATASGTRTLYLPLVSRMPPPGPSLSGRVFFDYNGSGLQEQGEPGISGAPVWIGSNGSALHATTGADSSYFISNVAPGAHQVYVQSPTQDPATAFRYINLFRRWVDIPAYEINGVHVPAQHLPDTDIWPIDSPLSVAVSGYTRLDVALMQGCLSLPYGPADGDEYWLSNYVDLDVREGLVRNYASNTRLIDDPSKYPPQYGTSDAHSGIDYECPKGLYVLASAPGVVCYVREDLVELCHYNILNQHLLTSVGHMEYAAFPAGQTGGQIRRGQILGLAGSYGTGHPHVHLNVNDWSVRHEGINAAVDPYMDLSGQHLHFEQHQGNPAVGYNQFVSIGSPGYWTKCNDPQFPLVSLGD